MPFVKKGVVIPDGGASDIDSSWAYNGSVVRFHNKYYCYYLGYTGSIIRICLAISRDLMHWTKKGIVIPAGGAGERDSSHSWKFKAIVHNNRIYIYYIGIGTDAIRTLCLATSKDGLHFTKKGAVIGRGSAGEIDDANIDEGLSIAKRNNKFYAYYGGYDGSNIRICLAISKDGVHFIKKGAVLGLGAVGEIDDIGSVAPEILKSNNKDYLFYTGNDGAVTRICYGSAKDGIHFTRKGVVIGVGAGGEIDDGGLYGPSVFLNNNKFNMLYDGSDGASNRICYAMSN